MNNPSPTTMKECSCPHPHDYCDFKETICQPSEEAEKCKCHCHRGHLKDHGFNYDNCAGEYCGHCTNLSQLSEEKYTGIVRDSEGNIVEIIDNIVGVKPNSTALEWEEQIRGLATDSGPGDKDEIIKIVKELLSFQQEEILNDLLKNGYGGGNYRRLILDKLSRRV